jgi:hypothetical protein
MTTRDLPPIIILLDAVGANRWSIYGHYRQTTPNLEEIAPEAAVYRRGFSLNRNRCRINDNSAGNRQPKETAAQIYPKICPS